MPWKCLTRCKSNFKKVLLSTRMLIEGAISIKMTCALPTCFAVVRCQTTLNIALSCASAELACVTPPGPFHLGTSSYPSASTALETVFTSLWTQFSLDYPNPSGMENEWPGVTNRWSILMFIQTIPIQKHGSEATHSKVMACSGMWPPMNETSPRSYSAQCFAPAFQDCSCCGTWTYKGWLYLWLEHRCHGKEMWNSVCWIFCNGKNMPQKKHKRSNRTIQSWYNDAPRCTKHAQRLSMAQPSDWRAASLSCNPLDPTSWPWDSGIFRESCHVLSLHIEIRDSLSQRFNMINMVQFPRAVNKHRFMSILWISTLVLPASPTVVRLRWHERQSSNWCGKTWGIEQPMWKVSPSFRSSKDERSVWWLITRCYTYVWHCLTSMNS